MAFDLSVPHELTTDEREQIAAYLDDLEASGTRVWEKRFHEFSLPGRPKLFIKFENDALAEAATQHFFYLCALGDPSAPRIAKVFDAFTASRRNHIIVMEKIDAPTLADCGLSDEEAVKQAAFAVKWLISQIDSVPETCFGSISADPKHVARHFFFQDTEAPRRFTDSEELSRYVSKASRWCAAKTNRRTPEEIMACFGESRCIYHSDIRKDNFLLDKDGNVYIIDFHHVGVLPEAFQSFAFFNTQWAFAAQVGHELGFQRSSVTSILGKISSVLRMGNGNFKY